MSFFVVSFPVEKMCLEGSNCLIFKHPIRTRRKRTKFFEKSEDFHSDSFRVIFHVVWLSKTKHEKLKEFLEFGFHRHFQSLTVQLEVLFSNLSQLAPSILAENIFKKNRIQWKKNCSYNNVAMENVTFHFCCGDRMDFCSQ